VGPSVVTLMRGPGLSAVIPGPERNKGARNAPPSSRALLYGPDTSLKGFWAVTVRANWRIIFRFADGRASNVDLIDYH
jgi:plasmid maintenance system killer protein